ncbi:hypothetical protein DY000_02059680 [Brassica cretica]|uniref:Uncharacterized protein n=1 Tax=Brassica cretica TaxID=69181 RepID=A0ABQ7AQR9_BRACR|nr:hypothetical protein DY000_02059680 [Brassica cretica]
MEEETTAYWCHHRVLSISLKRCSRRRRSNNERTPTFRDQWISQGTILRFAAVIMRIREPKTTPLIFASGKMYARIVQKIGFPAKFKDFKIQNIVGSCHVKFPIRLEVTFKAQRAPRNCISTKTGLPLGNFKLVSTSSHPLFCVFLNYIRCLKSYLLSLGQVLSNENVKFGYNAATGKYEDLMAAGIIDPTKVVRCCLEHAASVARHSRCQTVLLLRSRNLSQFQQATQWTTQDMDTNRR